MDQIRILESAVTELQRRLSQLEAERDMQDMEDAEYAGHHMFPPLEPVREMEGSELPDVEGIYILWVDSDGAAHWIEPGGADNTRYQALVRAPWSTGAPEFNWRTLGCDEGET